MPSAWTVHREKEPHSRGLQQRFHVLNSHTQDRQDRPKGLTMTPLTELHGAFSAGDNPSLIL